jgi:hypothetical protein
MKREHMQILYYSTIPGRESPPGFEQIYLSFILNQVSLQYNILVPAIDMKQLIFEEANKIWHKFTKDAADEDFTLPFEVHKKLLSLFHVGEFYYYIFNLKTSCFELMSQEIRSVLGYDPEEVDVPFYSIKFTRKINPFS